MNSMVLESTALLMAVTWQVSDLEVCTELSIVTKMWFNPSSMILLTKHSVKPLSPVPEETENADEADKDPNPLLMEHSLADAMSVSTYHTHTQTAMEPVEVRNNVTLYNIYNFSLTTHSRSPHHKD